MKRQLHLYLISWNCARIPRVTSTFTEHILGGIPDGSPAPDILVLALQEAAPLSYAFLGGEYLDPYVQGYVTAIQNATRSVLGEEYTLVGSNNVGMTVVLVFVKDGNLNKVKTVDYGGVGCGLWDMGNKGGVGVKITYEVPEGDDGDWLDTSAVELNFVGAHLAPHEWLVERRNQDWEAIVRGIVFEKGQQPQTSDGSWPLLESDTEVEATAPDTQDVGIYSPNAHTFFMGDLNYRTALSRPTKTDHLLFPQPRNQSNGVSKLFEGDQCHLERISGRSLQGFTEAQIHFPPTYKYKVKKGRQYNSSHWEWSGNRWPSWTDRILYLPWNSVHEETSDIQDEIVVHRYTSIPQIMDSDHKPVTCYLSIPAKPLYVRHDAPPAADALRNKGIRFHPPYPINPTWKEQRAAARVREVVVGVAAFLTTTHTGIGMLIGVAGGFWGLWWLLAGPG